MVMVETSVRSGFMEPNPFPRTRAEARNGSPFARLEAGAHEAGGVQAKE
jgi:hypothetical protein